MGGSSDGWERWFWAGSNGTLQAAEAKLKGLTDEDMKALARYLESGALLRFRGASAHARYGIGAKPLFLHELNLGHNYIGDTGVRALTSSLLAQQVSVRKLWLNKNLIASAGAKAVADLIADQRAPLEEVHLSHNYLGSLDVQALLAAAAQRHEYPRRGKQLTQPLWLRVEAQLDPEGWNFSPDEQECWRIAQGMVSTAEREMAKIRLNLKLIPSEDVRPLICIVPAKSDGCKSSQCCRGHAHGPIVHLPYFWKQPCKGTPLRPGHPAVNTTAKANVRSQHVPPRAEPHGPTPKSRGGSGAARAFGSALSNAGKPVGLSSSKAGWKAYESQDDTSLLQEDRWPSWDEVSNKGHHERWRSWQQASSADGINPTAPDCVPASGASAYLSTASGYCEEDESAVSPPSELVWPPTIPIADYLRLDDKSAIDAGAQSGSDSGTRVQSGSDGALEDPLVAKLHAFLQSAPNAEKAKRTLLHADSGVDPAHAAAAIARFNATVRRPPIIETQDGLIDECQDPMVARVVTYLRASLDPEKAKLTLLHPSSGVDVVVASAAIARFDADTVAHGSGSLHSNRTGAVVVDICGVADDRSGGLAGGSAATGEAAGAASGSCIEPWQ